MATRYSTLDITSLERLPNELFLEIFRYLSGVDVVVAFVQLNQRFRSLVLQHCLSFNFQSISREKFDYVIQHHNVERWKSLTLSNDEQTPGQFNRFSQQFSWQCQLPLLEHLTIRHITPLQAELYLSPISSLIHLVSLNLDQICGKTFPAVELPALKSLRISSCLHCAWMKNLSNLENLHHTLNCECSHEALLAWPKQLKKITIVCCKYLEQRSIQAALLPLAKLNFLSVYDCDWQSSPPDGLIWEDLIRESMPLLKTFEFCFKFWRRYNDSEALRALIGSFSTPFYLAEKRCFVQCDAVNQNYSAAMIYSLPFAFDRFDLVGHCFDQSLSTWRSDRSPKIYSKIKQLTFDTNCFAIDPHLLSTSVENLKIVSSTPPINWLPLAFQSLRQLEFSNEINLTSNGFCLLLEYSSQLTSLIVPHPILRVLTNNWLHPRVRFHLSRKIRSLKLLSTSPNDDDFVPIQDCVALVKVFGQSCEHLTLNVLSRNLVFSYILKWMRRLRSLKVRLIEHDEQTKIDRQWLAEGSDRWRKLADSMTVENNEYSFWL